MIEPFLSHTPTVDPLAFVHDSAVLIGDVSIGPESSIRPTAVLRGDDGPIRIGAQTSIQDGSVVHMTTGLSTVSIGDRVTVGHKVILHGCTVEDECLIGMGAIILDNAVIGRGSVIGAGALVTQNKKIPPGSLVFGSPAKIIRPCGDPEAFLIDQGWKEYVERCAQYRP